MKLETINGSSNILSRKLLIKIPTSKGTTGDVEIQGYQLNRNLSSAQDNDKINLNSLWPNLDPEIKREAEANRFTGPVDMIIGQDNYWSLVLEETLIHHTQKYGIINTRLGYTFSGSVATIPMSWQRELAEEIAVYNTYTDEIQNQTNQEIARNLFKLFEKEEEKETGPCTV